MYQANKQTQNEQNTKRMNDRDNQHNHDDQVSTIQKTIGDRRTIDVVGGLT
jgi:hypothetical protein